MKEAYEYATNRLADPDYPRYNDETEIAEAYEQGYKNAIEKASLYIYHLTAHPNVHNIDGEELVESFKKFMEEQK